MTMEIGFYDSAMVGIAISIGFALLVLIISTCNIVVSLLAAVSITAIVLILVGLM